MSGPVNTEAPPDEASKRTIHELSLSTSGANEKKKPKPDTTTRNQIDESSYYGISFSGYPPHYACPPMPLTSTPYPTEGQPHPPMMLSYPANIRQPPPSPGRSLSDEDIRLLAVSVKQMLASELTIMVQNEIRPLVSEIKHLRTEVDTLRQENDTLKYKLDDLEQYGRRPLIRVSGIPETQHAEDNQKQKEDTTTLFLEACSAAGITVSEEDIERSHRVGKLREDGKPRQVIVRTTSSDTKFYLIQNSFKFKDTSSFKKVSINEDLTKFRDELLYHCRVLYRNKKILKTWSTNGNVKIKDKSNQIHIIRREYDLVKFGHVITAKE